MIRDADTHAEVSIGHLFRSASTRKTQNVRSNVEDVIGRVRQEAVLPSCSWRAVEKRGSPMGRRSWLVYYG